jgi:hypothetical protein
MTERKARARATADPCGMTAKKTRATAKQENKSNGKAGKQEQRQSKKTRATAKTAQAAVWAMAWLVQGGGSWQVPGRLEGK